MKTFIISILIDPFKSAIASLSFLISSYLPKFFGIIMINNMNVDTSLQRLAWTLTIIVSATAIYTFIKKEIKERYGNNKNVSSGRSVRKRKNS